MKKKTFMSVILSAALIITSVVGVPMSISAEDNDAASDIIVDENMIYGDIAFNLMSKGVNVYTGDELDLSDVKLWLTTYSGYYSDYALPSEYNCTFTVGSGLHSNMYTLDTSQVDMNKAGDYKVIIKPKAGAVDTFSTKNNQSSIGNPVPDGDYDICMKGKESYIPVKVYDKAEAEKNPLYLRFFSECLELYCNGGVGVELIGALASTVRYEIEDETIAKINDDSSSDYLHLSGLKEGETTVTVYTSDGRTTTEKIKVLPVKSDPDSEPAVTTVTTLADPSITTTTTTAVLTEVTTTSTKWWYKYETTDTTDVVFCTSFTDGSTLTTSTEPVRIIKGDINSDGEFTLVDIVVMRKLLTGTSDALPNEAVADVNGDGRVNVVDYLLLIRAALGKCEL